MTRPSKKERERFFVEEAAKRLGANWAVLGDRENPDFLISDGDQKFGLEVRQVFNGSIDQNGSSQRRRESEAMAALEAIRRSYERNHEGASLQLKFIGRPTAQTAEQILSELVARNLHRYPVGHLDEFTVGAGEKVFVRVGNRPHWICLADRAGWVNPYPGLIIQAAISEKAERLSSYKASVGGDVRLLLVADRILNSGKMELSTPLHFDHKGFSAVYFLSYPDSLTILEQLPSIEE